MIPMDSITSGDKSDHAEMAKQLVRSASCTVAVPNYRLSPRIPTAADFLHHPAHAEDVLASLNFLLHWSPSTSDEILPPYDRSKLVLVGHSCGAHILTTIFLQAPPGTITDSHHRFNVTADEELVKSIRGIVLVEGIYDIDLLLSTFPSYRDFIEGAFSPLPSFTSVSTSSYNHLPKSERISWKVVQSAGDTLIDVGQADTMYRALQGASLNQRVSKDYTSITEDHDALLLSPPFIMLLSTFVVDVAGTKVASVV